MNLQSEFASASTVEDDEGDGDGDGESMEDESKERKRGQSACDGATPTDENVELDDHRNVPIEILPAFRPIIAESNWGRVM